MEESLHNKDDKFSPAKRNNTGRNTLIVVGIIFIVLGVGGSLLASRVVEKFFWEARSASVIKTTIALHKDVDENDIKRWQDSDARNNIEIFGGRIKQYLPNIAAMKIFAPDGTIAWTDLRNIKSGFRKEGIEKEIREVEEKQHLIKPASETTKKELDKKDLLEIWTVLKNPQGQPVGFIELYFDSTDILLFIKKLQYSIWGTVTFILVVILVLLRLTFRKQNDLIVHQAQELSNVIEKSPIGIYIINQKGIITTINKKMLELINEKDARKVIGQDIFTLPAVQRLKIDELIRNALLGTSFKQETLCTTESGNDLCQYYQATPLFAEDQKTVEQVLLTVEDITNQKRLEADLAEQAKGLESLVAERTKKLASKIEELEQFQRVTVDRELRMTELKQQIESMRIKLEKLGFTSDTA